MSAAPYSNPLTGGGKPDLRVVLVGRTGLDQTLRLDPAIELLRAKGATEAIGELGQPSEVDVSYGARRSIVVVASGVVTQQELPQLIAALRRVEPGVCVVGLIASPALRAAAGDPARYGLDGWLAPPVNSGVLRLLSTSRTLAEADPEPVAEQLAAPRIPAAPAAPVARNESSTVVAGGPATNLRVPAPDSHHPDVPIIQAMMTGADATGACMKVLRAVPGFEGVAFTSGQTRPERLEGRVDAAVMHKGHTFGWLSVAATDGEAAISSRLANEAEWLAHWLALREQQSQLRRAAFSDPLTGAWNRRYFDGFLGRAIDEAREGRHDLSLLLFDVDNFKQYNDQFGHGAGDEILTETVNLLKSVVRPSDKVCRIGGDEFAVIFHEPDGPRAQGSQHPESIFAIAKRFQRQIAEARFRKLGDQARGPLGISGGMATFPWDGHDAASLLEHADRLLMDSKRQGKNVLRFGPGAMRALGCDEESASG